MSEVLLLGRYRHLRPDNLNALPKQYPGLRFTWKTIHGSKGLEADYVVVLGLCSGKYGFPAEIADDPLLDLVLAVPEDHPNAEERRLLYVAVTRARRQAFLLADGGPPSEFVTELTDGGYDVRDIRPPTETRRALSSMPRRTAGAPRKLPQRKNFLRVLELSTLRANGARLPKLQDRPSRQVGRGLPVPRLRRDNRSLPYLRWMAGSQDRQIRPLSRLLELPELRLHTKPETVARERPFRIGCVETPTGQTTLTAICRIALTWFYRNKEPLSQTEVHLDALAGSGPSGRSGLRTVAGAGYLDIERLGGGQMGVVCLHCGDYSVHRAAVEGVHGRGPGVIEVAQLRVTRREGELAALLQ